VAALLTGAASADAKPIRFGASRSVFDLAVPVFGGDLELGVGDRLGLKLGGTLAQGLAPVGAGDRDALTLRVQALWYGLGDSGRGAGLGLDARHRWQTEALMGLAEGAEAHSKALRLHAVAGARWSFSAGVFVAAELGGGVTGEHRRVPANGPRPTGTRSWGPTGHVDLRLGYAFIGGAGQRTRRNRERAGYWQLVGSATGWIACNGLGLYYLGRGDSPLGTTPGIALTALSPALGWGVGHLLDASKVPPDTHEVALTNSFAAWTGALLYMVNRASERPFSKRAMLGLMMGTDLALLAASVSARDTRVSRLQVLAVDAGGVLGVVVGQAVAARLGGTQTGRGRAMLVSTALGMGAGATMAAMLPGRGEAGD